MPSAAPGQDFDAIVIGGGVNGLVCAILLAQAKRRVILLEAQDRVGGMCRTSEIAPGFRVSTVAHLVGPLDAEALKSLKLLKLGLQFTARQTGAVALSMDGNHILLGEDLRHTSQSLQVHSASDARAWAPHETRMRKAAQSLQAWTHQTPAFSGGSEPGRGGLFGGRSGSRASAQLEPDIAAQLEQSIADLLDVAFESPLLKGALALDAILGNAMPPNATGTALLPVLKRSMEPQNTNGLVHPQGGAGGLTAALVKAAELAGLKIRTGAKAVQFLFDGGRIAGVQMASGEAVYAPHIVSSLDPQETYLRMGAERDLPFGFKRQLYGYRNAGAVAKINLALSGLPSFKGLDKRHLKERLLVCSSVAELERSFAAFEQGRFSSDMALEVTIPSVHDASLARPGTHVMSINATYVPRRLASGTWEQARAELVSIVGAKLRQYAPELPDLVVAADVYTPEDLAEMSGGAGCHWHGGDLSLDQLGVFRPALNAGRGASPVPGLYLCGAGTHPLGGVTGTNGRLAAEAVLAASAGTP